MNRDKVHGRSNSARYPDSEDRLMRHPAVEQNKLESVAQYHPLWREEEKVLIPPNPVPPSANRNTDAPGSEPARDDCAMTFAEFVESRFVPEYVASKRLAGRAHFEAILKHVLKPQQVIRAFRRNEETSNGKLKELPGWPYIDSYRLHEVSAERVQQLIAASVKQGYSTQTATHIRNVVRTIFSHAQNTRCYSGRNPASLVVLPAMLRKEPHALTVDQLRILIPVMQYPERIIAIFSTLTDMNVAEICGLQWRYVNLANHRGRADGEWIPPMNIAARKQWYRGQLGQVIGGKKRFVAIPKTLGEILAALKTRNQYTGPYDFVLISGNGTPIHPQNIAARRLKTIGRALDMPWLSWSVFRRTRVALRAEYGRFWNELIDELMSQLSR